MNYYTGVSIYFEIVDKITKEFFFKKVDDYLAEYPQHEYMIWVSDIQGLKVINEKYGYEKGNAVLRIMADHGIRYMPGFLSAAGSRAISLRVLSMIVTLSKCGKSCRKMTVKRLTPCLTW